MSRSARTVKALLALAATAAIVAAPGARAAQAGITTFDLAVSITDGAATAVPGTTVTYTATATNAGPGTAATTFTSTFDFTPGTWSCVGSGGATCSGSGSGPLADPITVPSGGSVTYTIPVAIPSSATGTAAATVAVNAIGDTDDANDTATDTDTLTPQADLAISKTDGVTSVNEFAPVTYTITAVNNGPSDAPDASIIDVFPPSLSSAAWTCAGSGGGTCTASGSGSLNETADLPAGGSVIYTVTGFATSIGTMVNTATIAAPAGVTDPNSANDAATDTDAVVPNPEGPTSTSTSTTTTVPATVPSGASPSGTTTTTLAVAGTGLARTGAVVWDLLRLAMVLGGAGFVAYGSAMAVRHRRTG